MDLVDLNAITIPADGPGGTTYRQQSDNSADGAHAVYFKDLRGRLIEHIQEADYVFGCVAWLTDPEILAALSEKKGVCILIQKEDFLRPDTNSAGPAFKREILEAYGKLHCSIERFWLPGLGGSLSTACDPGLPPVRVVGVKNTGRATPRMHHKFAVFARLRETPDSDTWSELAGDLPCWPYEVWTGSFNWTRNAARSLENAIVLRHPKIVRAYFREWMQVLALSEPLDWSSEYIDPEWRIGT